MQESEYLFSMDGFKKDDLQHYGIKGQKWGIRRYQNPDGTRTPEGKKRYSKSGSSGVKVSLRKGSKISKEQYNKVVTNSSKYKKQIQDDLINSLEKDYGVDKESIKDIRLSASGFQVSISDVKNVRCSFQSDLAAVEVSGDFDFSEDRPKLNRSSVSFD